MADFRQDSPAFPRKKPELDLSRARANARAAWDKGESLAAAGDIAGGLAWLERAYRLARSDQNLCFALASLRLRGGQFEAAASLFRDMAQHHDVRECWTGLAVASLHAGRLDEAAGAAQRGLAAHAADPVLAAVATEVAARAGLPGWCGLLADGALLVHPPDTVPDLRLDGLPCAVPRHRTGRAGAGGIRLPPAWQQAARLAVTVNGVDLLGSPIDLAAVRRVEGFVERLGDTVKGWAWLPSSPDTDPRVFVTISGADGAGGPRRSIVAKARLAEVTGDVPLARPRSFSFRLPRNASADILGPDGRHLLGSPICPELPEWAGAHTVADSELMAEPDLPVDVIVPAYRGLATTLACLNAVLATLRAPDRLVVVDDASPEPQLVSALDALAAAGRIVLIRPAAHAAAPAPRAGGFPAAVNAGMRAAAGRHVVLLNSDTLVAPGWLHTLRAAVCSAPDIGTGTPLSNEASIFSYPLAEGGNPAPNLAETRKLARMTARANAHLLVDVPTANGFCMFIRRDCLAATGLFEERAFAQGYGEENDFCERASSLGYRHVAVPGVFVAHVGGVSFGAARSDLLRRNVQILDRRHPGYRGRVADFLARDPLAAARRRLDAARWKARLSAGPRTRRAMLLVTHGGGGGTARIVAERAQAAREAGLQPIVLRAVDGLCEVGDAEDAYPNLAFQLPAERRSLASLLASGRPVAAEIHHLLGHDHSLMRLIAELGVPYEVWVHDYAWFCARLSFVTGDGRFCGEAPASVCESCLALWGRGIEDPISPSGLRLRSATDLRGAQRVVVPTTDVARRVTRHVPGVLPEITPWETVPPFRPAVAHSRPGRCRVAVIGAIGLEKGFDVLLACARDAAARDLLLEFIVVGYTVDDTALLDTGRVFVTGEFTRAEAAGLIRRQDAHLAFLPSIWPETWCYALSDAWSAGLSAAVFDIGSPADRIRQSGAGWVLPLGLPAPRVNDVLLSLSPIG